MIKHDRAAIFKEWMDTGMTLKELAIKHKTSADWMSKMITSQLKPKRKEPKQDQFKHF